MDLIFDFDGTLIDSFHQLFEKFNILAEEFGFRKILTEEIPALRDLSSKQLIKHFKIPLYKIPRVIYRARKYMSHEMTHLTPFDNLHEVLQKLVAAKHSLGIVTSNSKDNVLTWLEINKMKHFFHFIHTESSYFGKNSLLKKVLKKHNIDKSQAFYIGDETRDIEAAKKNGIFSVAVTWGFNSEKILLQQQPDYVARKPEDLLLICSG